MRTAALSTLYLVLVQLPGGDPLPSIRRQPAVVALGPVRQLFVDDYLIDRMDSVFRSLGAPAKERTNPVFKPEMPWEGRRILYSDVLFDPDEKVYKLWYSVHDEKTNQAGLCYSRSPDGLHFERPELGLVSAAGSTRNNLILLPAGGMASDKGIFKDQHDPDPRRRYKMVYMKPGTIGMSVAWSADGLRWTAYEHNPVLLPTGDGGPKALWDELRGRYLLYVRPDGHHVRRWSKVADAADFPTRRIGLAESVDFKMWTDVEQVLAPDERDGVGTEFYYMLVLPYQGMYVGFLMVYHEYTGDPRPLEGFNYTLEVQLTASRDGRKWTRVCERQTFLGGDTRTWDEKRIYADSAVVRGDEIWIYYRGSNVPHRAIGETIGKSTGGRTFLGDALGIARLRLDGFVAVQALDRPGILTTKPLSFDSARELRVNVAAAGGSLEVEALTLFGEPIRGFTRQECRSITADEIHRRVEWSSGRALGDLPQPVRLRFFLRNASLYSFELIR
ncbi:MAG: hypothetical protein DMG07_11030 [Acidobacteria bacterium]|nr:MAG: hypothetical protein DMG07_11030 [Acidobacteriota bacterium]